MKTHSLLSSVLVERGSILVKVTSFSFQNQTFYFSAQGSDATRAIYFHSHSHNQKNALWWFYWLTFSWSQIITRHMFKWQISINVKNELNPSLRLIPWMEFTRDVQILQHCHNIHLQTEKYWTEFHIYCKISYRNTCSHFREKKTTSNWDLSQCCT